MKSFGENLMAQLKFFKPLNTILIFAAVIFSGTAMNQTGFDLAKGAIVDNTNEIIYVSHPEKGIDAISIISGNVLWHTDDAARPVLVRDGQLIAQDNATSKGIINLVAFDSNSGALLTKEILTAPNKVLANSSEGLEHKFTIKANYHTNPLGDIDWSYSYKVAQGIAPQMSSTEKIKDNKIYGQINLSQSPGEAGQSLLSGATLKTLSQKPTQNLKSIVGNFLEQNHGRQFTSMSKTHVLISEINDKLSTWEKYNWEIYDMNNQLLGSFLHYNSYRPFEVIGDTVLFITLPAMKAEGNEIKDYPFMVNAYSLSEGKQKWTHEIKDHSYQGPLPH